MKKGIIALGLMASTFAAAQDIYKPGKGEGIVYFLPKTALQVNIIDNQSNSTTGRILPICQPLSALERCFITAQRSLGNQAD